MKTIFSTLTILLLATATFAQRANNQWSNENVQTISGTIYDNSRPTSYMIADNGTYYQVHLGPIWFWNHNNYVLTLAEATIKGNVKIINGDYNIYPYTIKQAGTTMIFSDDNGIPKWSKGYGKGMGRGKGNGNGWGRGNCCRNRW